MNMLLTPTLWYSSGVQLYCNGKVERFNGTLTMILCCFDDENPANWCVYVPFLCFSHNMETHRSTATTPFDLVLSISPP